MHNAFNTSLHTGDDEEETDTEGKYGANPLPNVTPNDDDPLLRRLPSDGYRIYNQRPSVSSAGMSHETVNGLLSSSVEEANIPPTRRAFARIVQYSAKNWSIILLVFVPAGVLARRLGYSDGIVFILNCLAILALTDWLCQATDSVSSYLGETAGALLNVTMGNATEVVILHALVQRQYMIVRTSLLGSIIVNILLVLGVAIITGEFQLRGQRYSIFATRIAAALLGLTTVSLLVPSTIRTSKVASKLAEDVLNLSRGISIVLMLIYVLSLFTQMRSTRFGYAPLIKLDPDGPEPIESVQIEEMAPRSYHRRTLSYPRDASMSLIFDELPIHTTATEPRFRKTSFLDIPSAVRKANSVPWIRKCVPFIGLLASTAMIALCGGYLLESIDHVVDHSPFSKTTVGLIILPLVGNAAELVSGIMFASRKQMDLAFAVSIGSAIQMALFVTPLMVLVGWGIGREMSLHFTLFESISLIASTVSFSSLVLDDRCSMLKGIGLLVGYIIIGLASNFVPNLE